jgi:hypothetical protein
MAMAACVGLAASGAVVAQQQTSPQATKPAPKSTQGPSGVVAIPETNGQGARSAIPERQTLLRMMQRVSVNFQETSLEAALGFLQTVTQADLEVMWADDDNGEGLAKDTLITMKAENLTALRVLEILLERADAKERPGSSGSTWQMSDTGAMQVGPRERLNKYKRTEVYDIADLLLETPNYTDAPELDLQQALQASQQGGGGGQSPFQQEGGEDPERRPLGERADELIDVLTSLVEEDQWEANGGNGGTIRRFQKALIVKAPDYMHRALNGYSYWPSSSTTVGTTKGRRYVSLSVDTAVSDVGEIVQYPITVPGGG